MRYTIYVFDQTVTDFEQVLAAGKLTGTNAFEPVTVANVTFDAQGYLQRNRRTTPSWLGEVLPYCDIANHKNIRNTSNSLIVAIKTKSGTICAVTHGQGFMNLNKEHVIEGCGLDVAHRILKPTEIKAIDSKGVGAASLQKRHVAGRTGDLATFPLNYYRDRIRRIEGKSTDTVFGNRFSGGTSCAIDGKVTFSELGAICEAIVDARKKPKNRRFSATVPYSEVKDTATIDALREHLRKELLKKKSDNIGMFTPEIDDWSRVSTFQVQYGGGNRIDLEDLDANLVSKEVSASANGKVDIGAVVIHGVDGDGVPVFKEPFERIATFETSYKGKPYALSDGKWFLLEQDFVKTIVARANEMFIHPSGYLPEWLKKMRTEEQYNLSVTASHGHKVHVLDRKTINVIGRGDVEPCDLVTDNGHFIHVKKWSASQTFSALVKQGENSATLLRNHQDFRDGLLKKLPVAWLKTSPWDGFSADFRAHKHRIVFAVPDKPHRKLPNDLPIFSKISLVETNARLRADNFDVGFYHVPLHR